MTFVIKITIITTATPLSTYEKNCSAFSAVKKIVGYYDKINCCMQVELFVKRKIDMEMPVIWTCIYSERKQFSIIFLSFLTKDLCLYCVNVRKKPLKSSFRVEKHLQFVFKFI